jgi:hypothetical protein
MVYSYTHPYITVEDSEIPTHYAINLKSLNEIIIHKNK